MYDSNTKFLKSYNLSSLLCDSGRVKIKIQDSLGNSWKKCFGVTHVIVRLMHFCGISFYAYNVIGVEGIWMYLHAHMQDAEHNYYIIVLKETARCKNHEK